MRRPGYLDLGRRRAFGRPVKKPVGPVDPPPDPSLVADFDLGTWRVRPSLGRMTRADRIVALDKPTLLALLILAESPAGGVNRDELAARVYGGGTAEDHEPKLRRVLGLLRRVLSEDGAVRIANAPGDAYVLEVGAPVPGRGLKPFESDVLRDDPGGVEAWTSRKRKRWLAIGLATLVVGGLAAGITALVERGHVVLFGIVTQVRALATEPGEKTHPSFSPDGRQVVYSWRLADGSGTHLVLRPVTGGSWRPLTLGDGRDLYPAWSPSGGRIAFERLTATACSVYVIAPDGGGERRVGDCDFGATGRLTWTPDGRAVIYAHRTAAGLARQLVSLDVDTAKLTGVTNPVVGMPGDMQPTLAPTGRRLVFVRSRAVGVEDLSLLDLGTVAVERITRDRRPLAGAAFEAGTQSVVFASPRGGRYALWRVRLNHSSPEPFLAAPNALKDPAISNDNRALAYEEWQYTTAFSRIPDGAALAAGAASGASLDRHPQLSPDGKELVFVSNRGGSEQLWLAPAAGGAARMLTRSELDFLETPRWSPDGRLIVFAGSHKGRFELWTVALADGKQERVSSEETSRAPSFSHDGRYLYFTSSRSGSPQIWRQPWPGSGSPEAVTTEGGLAALESTDGASLYYVRADRPGLWLRNPAPGGDDSLVVADFSPADWTNWTLTGTAIWLIRRPDFGFPELDRYSIESHLINSIRAVPDLLDDSGMSVTPDGTGVIVTTVASARADVKLATLE